MRPPETQSVEAIMSDEAKKAGRKTIKIDVKMDDELALGTYANMARIFHNQTEFVLDALFLPPQSREAHVRSRVLLSPVHAKFLHAALGRNLAIFEEKFGPIKAAPPGSDDPGSILH